MSAVDLDQACVSHATALAEAARRFAAAGALGDTVLGNPASRLPEELAAALRGCIRPPDPGRGFRVVRGLLAAFDPPGPTPSRWSTGDRDRSGAFDVALVLVGALLGRVFGWVEQQDGRVVHNILPTRGCEQQQVGASSTAALAWHTEDAFHPERADLLLLACVRNDDAIGSSLSCTGWIDLDQDDVEQLTRPHVVIRPDDSYGEEADPGLPDMGVATLWRRPGGLSIRYDPTYSRILTDDPDFVTAYDRLGAALQQAGTVVPITPGDVLIIDNNTTVHGREAFEPRYDGTDRWLKRVLVRASGVRLEAERREHGYAQRQVDPCAVAR